MSARVVTIDLGSRSYDIYIGEGLLFRILDFMPEDVEGKKLFLICDQAVKTSGATIESALKQAGAAEVHVKNIKAGEAAKSFAQTEKITGWMLDHAINRNSIVCAIGGGVIGDLGGFCASIALRGVPYIQIPTTLLAQVDSSVGGKTGINMPQGKNLVGSFYQPSAVIMDIETLKTLPKRELLAGYAEIVKYGLINNSGFFNWLEQNGEAVCNLEYESLVHAIETSVKAKAEIVEADEKETDGKRALLNLGHTFAHALETAAGYNGTLLHGEAVSIGIVMAFELSERMSLCEREDVTRVENHFTKIGLPTRASMINPTLDTSVDKLIEIMKRDKKVKNGKMNFILANAIGGAFMSDDVSEETVRDVLKESLGNVSGTASTRNEFKMKGVKGLWKSAFSSQS